MDLEALLQIGARLILTIGVLALGLVAVRFARRQILGKVQASSRLPDRRKKQIRTIAEVIGWLASALIVGLALMMLLSYFVDITPLLTGLGVLGLALSLGSQTLVKDLIGGIMILVENQYDVGDIVQIGGVTGAVERLTLRATYVRDVEGRLHLVPNGDVRTVSNVTKDWSRALVDIGVAYEENLERTIDVLEQVARAFADDPVFAAELLEQPTVVAPLSLGDWAITVRVMVKTQPGKQWGIATELRKRILAACEREHITLPYPRQEVLVQNRISHET